MVDKKDQWENMEYSNGQVVEPSYEYDDTKDVSDNYEQMNDQEYEAYEEYEDDEAPVTKKGNPLPMIIIFLLILSAGAFVVVPKISGNIKKTTENTQIQNINSISETANETSLSTNGDDLATSFFNDAGGENTGMMSVNFSENGETNVIAGDGQNSQIATVTEANPSDVVSETDLFENQGGSNNTTAEENNSIMVVYNKASRANPFKPPLVEKSLEDTYETFNDAQFEIIEPPVTSVPDENLTRLLQTQISGILYDTESPSAIINLNGIDQFVKTGDNISGYKIESITRDRVQISYKNNTYIAAVGELFTRGSLEMQPAVSNLEKKFAGRYKNQEELEE